MPEWRKERGIDEASLVKAKESRWERSHKGQSPLRRRDPREPIFSLWCLYICNIFKKQKRIKNMRSLVKAGARSRRSPQRNDTERIRRHDALQTDICHFWQTKIYIYNLPVKGKRPWVSLAVAVGFVSFFNCKVQGPRRMRVPWWRTTQIKFSLYLF